MRTGILLILLGVLLFTRTVFQDDNNQTIVGRILDGAPNKKTPSTEVGAVDPGNATALQGAAASVAANVGAAAQLTGPLAPKPKTRTAGAASPNHPAP